MSDHYYCQVCDYISRDAYNMRKHMETRKHIQMCNVAGKDTFDIVCSNENTEKKFECPECNATYTYRQSLWRHKQKMHS